MCCIYIDYSFLIRHRYDLVVVIVVVHDHQQFKISARRCRCKIWPPRRAQTMQWELNKNEGAYRRHTRGSEKLWDTVWGFALGPSQHLLGPRKLWDHSNIFWDFGATFGPSASFSEPKFQIYQLTTLMVSRSRRAPSYHGTWRHISKYLVYNQ